MKPYFICATPRTGTNLLCEALAGTGVAGKPDEYFGHMHVPRWEEAWGTEGPNAYLQRLPLEARTENGVWGVKVMMQYYDDLYDLLLKASGESDTGRFEIIEKAFGEVRYIWMSRRNKIAQAVSLHKAYQNFAWSLKRGDLPPAEEDLAFDFKAIDSILYGLVKDEADWEAYFRAVGRRPYVVVYEDFIEDYQATVNAVMRHLGIPYDFRGSLAESQMQKQANQLSEDWIERFKAEKQLSA